MRNGKRHAKAKPVVIAPRFVKGGPACERCRKLRVGKLGGLSCGDGHALDPAKCGAFDDATIQRAYSIGMNGR